MTSTQTVTEINKAAALRFFDEVVSQGKLDVLDEIVADDAVDSAVPAGQVRGRAGFVEHITWLRTNVEGVTGRVTDLIAEDDRVVVYWTIAGTQRGEIFGAPDRGRPFTGVSISTIRFRDGRITEYEVLPDRLGIVLQLTVE